VQFIYLLKAELQIHPDDISADGIGPLPTKKRVQLHPCKVITKHARALESHRHRTNALLQIYNLEGAISKKPRYLHRARS